MEQHRKIDREQTASELAKNIAFLPTSKSKSSYSDFGDGEKLAFLADMELGFYRDLDDAFRPSLLTLDPDGRVRDSETVELMQFVWSEVRRIILPRIGYSEPTPEGMLRPTEWFLIFSQTGSGKSTLEAYYTFWVLAENPWIQSIRSTMPIYAYSLDYPFVLRDDAGKRIPHPKYRRMKALREIEDYENCLFVADELPSLMPGRNFNDRRQFAVTSMARNFRKENVFVIATSQREKDPDPELRENFNLLIQPHIEPGKLTWRVWPNQDAEYSDYCYHPERYVEYPEDNSDDYTEPSIPWLFLAFDSRHKVPLEFQSPLTPEKSDEESGALMAWIKETDTGGIFANFYSRDEIPPTSELKMAVKAWDVANRKMYSDNELLLIVQDFKKKFHRIPKPDPDPEPASEEERQREFLCECGASYTDAYKLEQHVSGVRNGILGLTNRPLPKAQVAEYRRRHPKLVESLEARP
jgi:hypothetical protein